MVVITYKKQPSKTKDIIQADLEYRPPLNISRNFFTVGALSLTRAQVNRI